MAVLTSAEAQLTVTLIGDITCNGLVDVDDVLVVINEWGACEETCPPHCAGDIAPSPQGNCVVDVDDLLTVINNWSS